MSFVRIQHQRKCAKYQSLKLIPSTHTFKIIATSLRANEFMHFFIISCTIPYIQCRTTVVWDVPIFQVTFTIKYWTSNQFPLLCLANLEGDIFYSLKSYLHYSCDKHTKVIHAIFNFNLFYQWWFHVPREKSKFNWPSPIFTSQWLSNFE